MEHVTSSKATARSAAAADNVVKTTSSSATTGTTATTTATGLDVWLQRVGKSLPVGGTVRIPIVAGPPLQRTADPVDAQASHASFPCVLKFPSSTVTPNFSRSTSVWHTSARLYEQDVPPILDDADEADETDGKKRKKAWKYNRYHTKARQWILQEHVEFLETMLQQRRLKKSSDTKTPAVAAPPTLSSRYEGAPEFTPSQYVLFSLQTSTGGTQPPTEPVVLIRHLPATESTVAMIQPAARPTLSLVEAEQAIEDQRAGVVRPRAPVASIKSNATGTSPTTMAAAATAVPALRYVPPKVNNTKSRLLNKLKASAKRDDDDDEGDDVMANVTFRGKGTGSVGSKARRELLSTLGGDGGITVSDDGNVLGGSNDAAFGGRGQRFGASAVCTTSAATTTAANDGQAERGADGAAMADDFYTRDVSAEYEELDYDANEQFDDDDVDVGETELFAGDDGDQGDEHQEDDDDDDTDGEPDDDAAVGGAAGLATVAGFKALLAKARGDATAAANAATAEMDNANTPNGGPVVSVNGDGKTASSSDGEAADAVESSSKVNKQSTSPHDKKKEYKTAVKEETDHMSKILAAAEKSRLATREKQKDSAGILSSDTILSSATASATGTVSAAPVIATDEHGLRYITLEAVRREIWLNHGSIPITRLIKIFHSSKKHGVERQAQFRDVVKELCTMTTDPVHGRMLVLKQHYSHMS